MQWCCAAFHGHFENAGKRGLCVFADTTRADPRFVLQFRASESEVKCDSSEPISLLCDVEVAFCPWCGRKPREFYQKKVDNLARNELRVPIA